jgi:hypothetical protein
MTIQEIKLGEHKECPLTSEKCKTDKCAWWIEGSFDINERSGQAVSISQCAMVAGKRSYERN